MNSKLWIRNRTTQNNGLIPIAIGTVEAISFILGELGGDPAKLGYQAIWKLIPSLQRFLLRRVIISLIFNYY